MKPIRPHVWDIRSRLSPDVQPAPTARVRSPCGKNRDESIHSLSTENVKISANPHIGRFDYCDPYLGVTRAAAETSLTYFSTRNASYPQIKGTYPQKRCLDRS